MNKEYDAVVVGGGAAGLGCALSAAAQGAEVLLLEKASEVGGTVSHALIHTIGGLFDDHGDFINAGLPVQLTERLQQACPYTQKRRIGKTWVLNVDPAIYERVVTDWVNGTPNIEVHYGACVTQLANDGGYIRHISATYDVKTETIWLKHLIDTTGGAHIIRQIDDTLVADGMALGGYIVQIRGAAAEALQFPKGVAILRQIRKASDSRELPPECSTIWLDTGVYPDEVYAKFSVAPIRYDPAYMGLAAQQLLAFLQTLPGFANTYIHRYGEPGTRDAGRIKGEYCLKEQDVKEGKRFTDGACRACWPIEHWHPDKGVTLEYLPQGGDYDIPLRSLKVSGFTNLWAAGKCLSAEPRAQASARVAGTCWAMGEALGRHIADR